MDWNAMPRCRYMQRVPILLAPHRATADFPWFVIMGGMLAGLFLLLVVAGAIPAGEGEVRLDPDRQGILQAHPEWPAEVREAVVAGIICAGMSPDMVRAAWGLPTRTSGRAGPGQRETWHYEGRARAVERLGGQGRNNAEAHEWTVLFIDGRVAAWTD
jgi:hypothetical protein